MKIAQVTIRYSPAIGGVETHVKYLAEELSKRGFSVDIYTSFLVDTFYEDLSLPSIEKRNNIQVIRYKWIKLLPNRDTIYLQPKILYDILKKKYDIIHVHTFRYFPTYGGLLLSFFTKIPIIATLHHNPELKSTYLQKLHDILVKKFMNRFTKIIALTKYERNWLLSYGVEPTRVAVIPNGLPDSFLERINKITNEEITTFRRKLGINDKFVLLYIGRISGEKNLKIITKALKLLPDNVKKDIVFVFAGPDWSGEVKVLLTLAYKYKVHRNIFYISKVVGNEKALLLKLSKVFLLPSVSEAFSIATLEAMAAGLPVLASRTGGLRCLIRNEKTGFLLNPYNAKEWCEYIQLLYHDDKLRVRLGKEGRKNARRYRWSIIVDKIIKLYEEVLAKR